MKVKTDVKAGQNVAVTVTVNNNVTVTTGSSVTVTIGGEA
jgi:copper(I)-binding protein